MARTLTPEQREAKNARDRERRAQKRAARGGGSSKPARSKSKKGGGVPKTSRSSKGVDTKKLDPKQATKRLDAIYKLEKNLENKRVALELASANRRAAKAAYDEAVESLEQEIREQRTGPGPLFDGVDPGGSNGSGVKEEFNDIANGRDDDRDGFIDEDFE